MPTTTVDSHEIHVDDEGFMTQYDEWTEDLGKVLAAQIGIEMEDVPSSVELRWRPGEHQAALMP